MDLKKQILVALGLNKEQEEVNLEFQAKLEDGTIIVSTAVTLESGSDISVLTEDGSTILLPEGKYKTDEGLQFSVEKEGIVAELYTDEERETYKRALNLKLINLMITKIPDESKFCVSYGQLNGCYWTIPATSTQGTTKEGDKDYIVRASLSPNMDLELHKKVFLNFVKNI